MTALAPCPLASILEYASRCPIRSTSERLENATTATAFFSDVSFSVLQTPEITASTNSPRAMLPLPPALPPSAASAPLHIQTKVTSQNRAESSCVLLTVLNVGGLTLPVTLVSCICVWYRKNKASSGARIHDVTSDPSCKLSSKYTWRNFYASHACSLACLGQIDRLSCDTGSQTCFRSVSWSLKHQPAMQRTVTGYNRLPISPTLSFVLMLYLIGTGNRQTHRDFSYSS